MNYFFYYSILQFHFSDIVGGERLSPSIVPVQSFYTLKATKQQILYKSTIYIFQNLTQIVR